MNAASGKPSPRAMLFSAPGRFFNRKGRQRFTTHPRMARCPTSARAEINQNEKYKRKYKMKNTFIASFAALALLAATSAFADHTHTSSKFEGAKANTGTVTHT